MSTPSIDIYLLGGIETTHQSTQTVVGGGFVGYGAPNGSNGGCFNSVSGLTANSVAATGATTIAANRTGNTKRVFEIAGGFWDKLHKGSFGEVRVGVQYAYQQRELFQGNGTAGGTVPALGFAPKQSDQMVYTSLRYYPFQ